MPEKIMTHQEVNEHLTESVLGEITAPISELLEETFRGHLRPNEFFQASAKAGHLARHLKIELLEPTDKGTIFEFFMFTDQETALVHGTAEAIVNSGAPPGWYANADFLLVGLPLLSRLDR